MDNTRDILEYQIKNLKERRGNVNAEIVRVKESSAKISIEISENGENIERVQKIVDDVNAKVPKRTEHEKITDAAENVLNYIETIEIFKTVHSAYKKLGDFDKKFIGLDVDKLAVDREFLIQNDRLEKTLAHYLGSIEKYENDLIEIDGEIYKREQKLNRI